MIELQMNHRSIKCFYSKLLVFSIYCSKMISKQNFTFYQYSYSNIYGQLKLFVNEYLIIFDQITRNTFSTLSAVQLLSLCWQSYYCCKVAQRSLEKGRCSACRCLHTLILNRVNFQVPLAIDSNDIIKYRYSIQYSKKGSQDNSINIFF